MKLLLLFSVFVIFTGCGDSKEDLRDQTKIQTQEEINAENQNQAEWAAKLKADLKKKLYFLDAVEGEFEGEIIVNKLKFLVKVILVKTLPIIDIDRPKTIAELEYELQNSNFNIQVLQWNPNSNFSAVGCNIQNIKPDFNKGLLNLVSESCSNTYQLYISDEGQGELQAESFELAQAISKNEIDLINRLKGKLRTSTNAKTFDLDLVRN